MRAMKEWIVYLLTLLPPWLSPISPFGAKGRANMPEMHDTLNELTGLRLRVDRLRRREQREAEERQHYTDWYADGS